MSKKVLGNILAITLIVFALLPNNILPLVKPQPKPQINLDIDKPTDDILKIVKPIDMLVTNYDDRTKLAVFNYVFSKRVSKYDNITSQKLQDLYVLAAEKFFKGSMKDKYDNLDVLIKNLLTSVMSDENHILSSDDKTYLQNTFGGLAWSLIK